MADAVGIGNRNSGGGFALNAIVAGAFVVSCLAVGWAGSLVTEPNVRDWYSALRKPDWTPPNQLFAPVWTTLYVFIGVAGWLVWRVRAVARDAWFAWWAQFALNAAWSPLFFGAHVVGVALVVIASLLFFIVRFIVAVRPHQRVASLLFLPYAAWIAFASVLNFAIWTMN